MWKVSGEYGDRLIREYGEAVNYDCIDDKNILLYYNKAELTIVNCFCRICCMVHAENFLYWGVGFGLLLYNGKNW